MNNKLSNIYYSPTGYWKGFATISKLAKIAKVSDSEAKKWLEKQALWQIYLPPPNTIPRYHWTVTEPNQVHQADLLFLPHDTLKRKTYKYALVLIDVASRYKDAEALTSKESGEVSKSFNKIYSRRLNWPETLMVDPGREFMGNVTQLMKEIMLKYKEVKLVIIEPKHLWNERIVLWEKKCSHFNMHKK